MGEGLLYDNGTHVSSALAQGMLQFLLIISVLCFCFDRFHSMFRAQCCLCLLSNHSELPIRLSLTFLSEILVKIALISNDIIQSNNCVLGVWNVFLPTILPAKDICAN